MKKNGILSKLLIIIVVASFFGVFFVMSIMDLANKKDIRDIHIKYAYSILTVEHSINGLIPTGKSYYYLGIADGSGKAYLIHAEKNWLNENFDSDGRSISQEGYHINALEKRQSNYDVEKELTARASQVEGITLDQEFGRVLELHYKRDAILKLTAGVAGLILALAGFLLYRRKDTVPLWGRRVYLVCFVVVLVFALKTIL